MENYCYQPTAVGTLQLAVEDFMISLCMESQLLAIHAKRVTVTHRDFQLVKQLRAVQQWNMN
jgi:histone H3/H4